MQWQRLRVTESAGARRGGGEGEGGIWIILIIIIIISLLQPIDGLPRAVRVCVWEGSCRQHHLPRLRELFLERSRLDLCSIAPSFVFRLGKMARAKGQLFCHTNIKITPTGSRVGHRGQCHLGSVTAATRVRYPLLSPPAATWEVRPGVAE